MKGIFGLKLSFAGLLFLLRSSLNSFESRVGFADDIESTTTLDDLTVGVTLFGTF